jgi:hypothetical protein
MYMHGVSEELDLFKKNDSISKENRRHNTPVREKDTIKL